MKQFNLIELFRLMLCALCMGVASSPLFATEVTTLYEVAVPVSGQDRSERNRAIREAFADVLIKVTGDRGTPTQPELKDALNDTLSYVQQYRYHKQKGEDAGIDAGKVILPGLELRVSFDSSAVNQLLFESGKPVWGRARPATLIWLAVQDQASRYLVGSNVGQEFQIEISRQAQRRGIPLFFPLLDIEDQAALRFTDVWGNFQDAIQAASLRYQSEAVLVGRLYRRQDGGWDARWTLTIDTESMHWSSSAVAVHDVLAAGIDNAADSLALRYAQKGGANADHVAVLAVSAVQSLGDYARVLKYLESIDLVTNLRVKRIEGSNVIFQLSIRGDETGLKQTIAFGGTLTPANDDMASLRHGAVNFANQDDYVEKISFYRLLQ